MTKAEALAERHQQDQAFRHGQEPQTLSCDMCGRTGDAHCFGRFSFRGEAPEFLCVDCIIGRAQMVVDHCKNREIVIQYKPPAR